MVANWGIQTSIMDVGWPARAAATWSFPLAAPVVFVILGVNVVMLLIKQTRTVMVDFWSYNHYIFTGALVWYATGGNPWIALVAAAIDAIISFKLADWTTPVVEDYFELEGVNFPTSNSVCWAPIAFSSTSSGASFRASRTSTLPLRASRSASASWASPCSWVLSLAPLSASSPAIPSSRS